MYNILWNVLAFQLEMYLFLPEIFLAPAIFHRSAQNKSKFGIIATPTYYISRAHTVCICEGLINPIIYLQSTILCAFGNDALLGKQLGNNYHYHILFI